MKFSISVLMAVFTIAATGIEAQDKVATVKFEVAGYTITHPETWTTDNSGDAGTTFVLHSQLTGPEDSFKDNINLLEQGLPADQANLEKYVAMSIEQLPFFLTNSQLIRKEKIKRSKKDCYLIEYSGELNGFALHFIQYIWVVNQKAIILTFTAQPFDYEVLKSDALMMMDSFRFKI